ncbi:uncharacterized protein H6S33_010347 [Morchella sextelata]|uniref:uncharacterized protein n=1 Tax=Morchella sextelata TaxID=1174677 RepID=UPI001D0490CE|nr:uncharacterized protein H6S33_010347 [Morchella sextelata]KAH0612295.1 hypothetical protein H6S33_010347 [Morchella sextelata]
MVLHNPNNWHWVNKDAREWAQKYFDKNLTVLTASSGDTSVKVDKVVSVDGDVDVSQRKGKVITLFDVKMRLEFSGSTVDDPSVSGTITIPEIAHDTEEDEYVFEVDVYSDTPTKSPIRDLIRSSLIPQLRVALGKFSPDLIAEHGKDIQHAPGTGPSYTPSAPIIPAAASSSSTSVKKTTSSGPIVNTVTLTDSIEFQTSAEQLYSVFVDPGRVTAWSRSTPKVFEPKVGGAFSLFGGNVEGEFKVLEKDAKIVQSWRLGGWTKGHYSTLTLVFDQGSDSTTLRMTWEGVPVGEEEVTKRNFGEYYVKSIKQTFGYATLPPRVYRNPTTSLSPSSSSTALPVVAGGSAMAFAAKMFVAFVAVPVMAVVLLPVIKETLWDDKIFSV